MASEKGSITTESPLVPPPAAVLPAPALQPVGAPDALGSDLTRAKSLKRGRETTPTSPESATSHGDLSPSKIARLVGFARQSPIPPPLTGVAALEDERRRREDEQRRQHPPGISENPNHKALSELMSGVNPGMSRAHDGPTEVGPSAAETAAKALQPVTIPNDTTNIGEGKRETGPQSAASAASGASLGSGAEHVVDSPTAMDVDARNDRHYAPQPDAQMEDRAAATSLSYPGILPSGGSMPAPAPPRGMSLPMTPAQMEDHAARSPSSKKHKCHFCNTEFTRHHNLKSHLLTHSQEKPYLCQECNMRFRRLHDLKRHSKLHTGEKPHICPKCDRKFARADALARHSKGEGGCAGRRSSMGSFVGDDSYDGVGTDADESAMTGIIYDGTQEGELTEEERRRLSLPSIKAQHVPGQAGQAVAEGYASHSRSTYPPAGPRPTPTGGLFPPNVDHGTSSTTTSPTMPTSNASGHTPNTSISSMPLSAGSASMFSQSGMTESPKPLSPGVTQPGQDKNQRSANLQQQINARQPNHHAPSGLSVPPSGASQTSMSTAPQGGAARQPRATGGPPLENHNNLFASGEQGLWTYIHSLEDKVQNLGEELAAVKKVEAQLLEKAADFERKESVLSSEVALLRQQLGIRSERLPSSEP